MKQNENLNLGKELLKLRRLLKISQKDFARISLMDQKDLQEFEENKSENTFIKRVKICLALDKILKLYHEEYPNIVVNKIIENIQIINPFDTLEEFTELSNLIQKMNTNIDTFNKEQHRR